MEHKLNSGRSSVKVGLGIRDQGVGLGIRELG